MYYNSVVPHPELAAICASALDLKSAVGEGRSKAAAAQP